MSPFPSTNVTLFRSYWENGTHKYASLRSILHMCSFSLKRFSNDCWLFILKCRNGMYWFNSLKLITGLFVPSFFLTTNIFLRYWSSYGQICFTAPFFKRFSTSNEIGAFSCIKKFTSLFCFDLQRKEIQYPYSFSQLHSKCNNFDASGTVVIFKLQNNQQI